MKVPAKAKFQHRRAFASSSSSIATKKVIENPFDKFANNRKKHEVINRRVKGEDRNVGRAREKVLYFYCYHMIFFNVIDKYKYTVN